MAAYDYVLVGRIHHHRVTREDNAATLRMLETAIQLDPEFAEAYAWKACTLGQALEFGFCADFAETEKEAFAAIDKALSLDENDLECHRHLNVWGTKRAMENSSAETSNIDYRRRCICAAGLVTRSSVIQPPVAGETKILDSMACRKTSSFAAMERETKSTRTFPMF